MLGETRELSKIFFEQIRIKEVDTTVENEFKNLICELQEIKLNGINTINYEMNIERKIAEIYGISTDEFELINAID